MGGISGRTDPLLESILAGHLNAVALVEDAISSGLRFVRDAEQSLAPLPHLFLSVRHKPLSPHHRHAASMRSITREVTGCRQLKRQPERSSNAPNRVVKSWALSI